jgi:hypothetical protein
VRRSAWRWREVVVGVGFLLPVTALAAGSGHPGPKPEVVPDRTILLLQQDVTGLTTSSPDTVVYGGSREAELLRQIAAATRASAQAQIELLRQQNEIIRLLGELTRQQGATR